MHVLPPLVVVVVLQLLLLGAVRAAEVDPSKLPPAVGRAVDFAKDVRPIFVARCVQCHGAEKQKSGYRLDARAHAMKGGDLGVAPVVAGDSAKSPLIHYVAGVHPDVTMPPKGERLAAEQVGVLRAWIDQGARWPAEVGEVAVLDKADWWSLRPVVRPAVPEGAANPIDAFVLAKLRERGLTPVGEADRRTLIRRVTFDLTGLPPTPAEVEAFVGDPDPAAYGRLVDRLLASPRYGERWARHWLDAARYGDTHGYDKDKVRPNAWPYRDYVIRAFNEDKPYDRFVKEQLAGDHFYPGTADGVVATGFVAAGPWDFVGQVELREGTLDKAVTRNLDRDDMVSAAANTFVSLTAQCARCHNHKFDPIAQEDYYALQAVFAGVDRADRPYEADAEVAGRRRGLAAKLAELAKSKAGLDAEVAKAAGPELAAVDRRLADLAAVKPAKGERPEFGYHSAIAVTADAAKWVQVDLGLATAIDHVVLVGCHDTFNDIGAGFGFPVRYKVELSDDAAFAQGVTVVADHTAADAANPGVRPVTVKVGGRAGRYVRVTATKLAPRKGDFIFALGELAVVTPGGANAAPGKAVAALDSIEAPVRWRRSNLVDGYYYGGSSRGHVEAEARTLGARRRAILEAAVDAKTRERLAQFERQTAETAAALKAFPAPGVVYAAATDFPAAGSFTPTRGKPRAIHLLHRGSEKDPRQAVGPGTFSLSFVPELKARFELPAGSPESARRAALAEWVVDRRNPLTWRSIVNRVWQHHFGRGIVETPNDFGHMGALPTHPELLDWLAAELRDGDRSLKRLHRLIVMSQTYRRAAAHDAANARVDAANQYLWRGGRARLDAETVRDAVLSVAGKLDLAKVGGPPFRAFAFTDDHSPKYDYAAHDPDDAASHRRSVYRLVVRSVPDPFMDTLDCADASQIVARRNETLTPLQALALLNNRFVVRMAEHFAARLEREAGADVGRRIDLACRLAYGRPATELEMQTLGGVARRHGLAGACRVILNSNEFVFVD